MRITLLPLFGGGAIRQLVPDPSDPTEATRTADGVPSWSPGRRPALIRDGRAPVAQLIEARKGRRPTRGAVAAVRGSTRRPALVSRRTLTLLAFDTAGLRRVKVALVRGKRIPARPPFRLVGSQAAFRKLIRGKRPGRYQLLVSARDGRRNATRRPYRFPIVLRR